MSYQNYSDNLSPKAPSVNKKNKKLVIFMTSFGALAIAVVSLLALGVPGKIFHVGHEQTKSDSDVSQLENSSQASLQSQSETDGETLRDEEIAKERERALNFLSTESGQNLEEFVQKNIYSSQEIKELRDSLGGEASFVQSENGKRIKITIDYSSIGDEDFNNSSLYIKLSKGLTVESGSMVDSFNGNEIKVSDNVYNTETNIIQYGPGSSNKDKSPLKIGENGNLTLVLIVSENAQGNEAMASYLQEDGGKIGQPAIFFVDINK